jgi:hypothetical protein
MFEAACSVVLASMGFVCGGHPPIIGYERSDGAVRGNGTAQRCAFR